VAVFGFIFYSRCIDGDTARSFFRRFIDGRVVQEVCLAFFSQYFGDGRGQGGFTVINVSNGTDVYMRFGSFIMCFCHIFSPSIKKIFRFSYYTYKNDRKQGSAERYPYSHEDSPRNVSFLNKAPLKYIIKNK
jgi:hypothetical protein